MSWADDYDNHPPAATSMSWADKPYTPHTGFSLSQAITVADSDNEENSEGGNLSNTTSNGGDDQDVDEGNDVNKDVDVDSILRLLLHLPPSSRLLLQLQTRRLLQAHPTQLLPPPAVEPSFVAGVAYYTVPTEELEPHSDSVCSTRCCWKGNIHNQIRFLSTVMLMSVPYDDLLALEPIPEYPHYSSHGEYIEAFWANMAYVTTRDSMVSNSAVTVTYPIAVSTNSTANSTASADLSRGEPYTTFLGRCEGVEQDNLDSWTVSHGGNIIGNCWLNQDSNCLSVDIHTTLTMDTLTAIEEYNVLTDTLSSSNQRALGNYSLYSTPSASERASRCALRKWGLELLQPVLDMIRQYRRIVSYREPLVFVADTVHIALEVSHYTRNVLINAAERVRPLAEDIVPYVCDMHMFVAEHEVWASRTEKLLNEVMNLYYTRELLDNVLQRTSALADSHRLEYGMCIIPVYPQHLPYARLLEEGIRKRSYLYLRV
ncbi:hypothetical protein CPB85DRAFT_1259432 [Mucidula mucida]|nr:hypothetical protein CPB85DRAFT_1259432 [Mucidula mucida]